MKSHHTLHVRCTACGHQYDLEPVVAHPEGGGWYSSDADFCTKCGSGAVRSSYFIPIKLLTSDQGPGTVQS